MSKFEVIRGVEGCCLALDDTRIAGPKPWGGGTVIHAWEIDERTRAAIDDWMATKDGRKSRWHKLFGTPERAMLTIASWCTHSDGSCAGCPVYGSDVDDCSDCDSLLEWLRGDAE